MHCYRILTDCTTLMRSILLLSCLFCSFLLHAQANKFTLTGTLTMETGEQFPYKITGTDSAGTLKGFAFTYEAPNETKVAIRGKIDKQRQKITFRETEIIFSHDVHTTAFMCLLHASLENKNNILSGPANGEEADNTACTPGTLSFGKAEEINNLFSSHDQYDMEVTMGGPKKKDTLIMHKKEMAPVAAAPEQEKQEKITAGVEKTFNWTSDTIVVDVWDGGEYDGDRVTISLDDVPYLTRYVIQKAKKRLYIPLPATGTHTLAIRADDEGMEPPNTANMTLIDGEQRYNIIAYNNKGQISLVRIKKVHK